MEGRREVRKGLFASAERQEEPTAARLSLSLSLDGTLLC
jgi:hypothetical protein